MIDVIVWGRIMEIISSNDFLPNEATKELTEENQINFENPEKVRNKIAFDNLTPLYPDQQLRMETEKT